MSVCRHVMTLVALGAILLAGSVGRALPAKEQKEWRAAGPRIIAHRGGKQNWPENTLCAFRQDVRQGVDAIELDVQVTKDGVVVVYHPEDLSVSTNGKGPIAEKKAEVVTRLDASSKYPGPRTFETVCEPDSLRIPKLTDVLEALPDTSFIIDLKSLPAEPLIQALVKAIPEREWARLRFYSTSAEHTALLRSKRPDAVVFEDRNQTFQRLMTVAGSHQCSLKSPQMWIGYELVRDLNVCDKTKLGSTCVEKLPFEMWTPESVQCTRAMTGAKIILFGINAKEAYEKARKLGADAVFTDDPRSLTGR